MTKPKVFVTRMIPEKGLEMIRGAFDIDIWPNPLPPPYETLVQKVKGIDGLLCLLTDPIDAGLMDAMAPQLKVISQMAVGFDNIDISAATARGIPVGNTPGVLTDPAPSVQTRSFADSGIVVPSVPFPLLSLTISIHGVYCFDTVMTLRARPVPKLSVDRDLLSWEPDPPATSFDVVRGEATRWSDLDLVVLYDQAIAQLTETIALPGPGSVAEVTRRWARGAPEDFQPYAAGDDLVPPMARPGDGYRTHTTGLTHAENGFPTQTPDAVERNQTRLLSKLRSRD